MKKIKLLSILLLTLLKFAVAQQPFVSMGVVVFADGKYYKGKVLDETSDMVRIQFLPSNSIYEFNRLGVITKSTGTYKAGALVKQISVHELVKDIYAEENAVYDYGFIGVRFGDGKLFFALTDGIGYNIVKDAFFHTAAVYMDLLKRMANGKLHLLLVVRIRPAISSHNYTGCRISGGCFIQMAVSAHQILWKENQPATININRLFKQTYFL